MNNFRQIAEHYYLQIKPQMQGKLAETFQLMVDMQKLNPNPVPKSANPDKPQLSPEALARQQTGDKRVMDSINLFDEQQRGGEDGEDWED